MKLQDLVRVGRGETETSTEARDLDVPQRKVDRLRRNALGSAVSNLRIFVPMGIDVAEHRIGQRDIVGAVIGIRAFNQLDVRARRVPQIGARDIDVQNPLVPLCAESLSNSTAGVAGQTDC